MRVGRVLLQQFSPKHKAALRHDALERALGESLSEPKPQVWFDAAPDAPAPAGSVTATALPPMVTVASSPSVSGEAIVAEDLPSGEEDVYGGTSAEDLVAGLGRGRGARTRRGRATGDC